MGFSHEVTNFAWAEALTLECVTMRAMRRSSQRRARPGFSLGELLIVVAIMSILAAVALPKWSTTLQKQRISAAASRIVADLSRAQSAAYGTSTPKTVTFSVSSGQYTISGITSLNKSTGTYTVALTDDPYRCTLVSVWNQTGTQTLTFDGYGLPDKGGTIIVSANGLQKSIVVDAATGQAVAQ